MTSQRKEQFRMIDKKRARIAIDLLLETTGFLTKLTSEQREKYSERILDIIESIGIELWLCGELE